MKWKKPVVWIGATLLAYLLEAILNDLEFYKRGKTAIQGYLSSHSIGILTKEYAVWQFIVFTAVVLILYLILSRIFRERRVQKVQQQQQQVKRVISDRKERFKRQAAFIGVGDDIFAKTTIYFDRDGHPVVTDIEPYCRKHGTPLKMLRDGMWYRCSLGSCDTHFEESSFSHNLERMQNIVQSVVDENWPKFE